MISSLVEYTSTAETTPPEPSRQLYRVKTDREIAEQQIAIPGHGQFWEPGLEANWRKDLPAVFWLFGTIYVQFTEAQQRLAWAMIKDSVNDVKRFGMVYGHNVAFMNNTGFGDPDDPRWNYITNEDAGARLPRWDKIRVCANATLAGVETYSVMQALRDTYTLLRRTVTAPRSLMGNFQASAKSLVSNNMLIVDYIPHDNIPTWAELKPKKWLYFEAVSSTPTGDTTPFPQGVYGPIYIPLIARAEIRFPLAALERL